MQIRINVGTLTVEKLAEKIRNESKLETEALGA